MCEKTNDTNCIHAEYVKITNDNFFTKKQLSTWRIFIANCCCDICEKTIEKVDPSCEITYFLSASLVNEVIGDAVIGMGKIIDKTPHPIEQPNAFKIASYLSYWFLRHKPISVIYPKTTDLDKIQVASGVKTDAKYLSWQLKHMNESVAVNIATSYIFDFEKELCDITQCCNIKKKNICNDIPAFNFDNYNQQRQIMLQKLTYYFAYRAIAPKIIEHILEGYAFHPAWYLTGPHWNTVKLLSVTQEKE